VYEVSNFVGIALTLIGQTLIDKQRRRDITVKAAMARVRILWCLTRFVVLVAIAGLN